MELSSIAPENSSKSSTPLSTQNEKTKQTLIATPNINIALPKELILLVFSYLDITTLCRCAQVCKTWNTLAFDGSIWKRVDLFNFQIDVTPHVVEKIAQCSGGFLRDLRLSGCLKVNNDAIKRFTELCKQIEILDLSDCKDLTNDTCKYLGLNCSVLTTLILVNCHIDGKGLKHIGACENLTWLDVSWCEINDEGVQAIASGCRNLTRFRAIGCTKLTSISVGYLARFCENLTLLNFNYCERNINDQAMIYLAIGCSNLKVLCVSRCAITDIGLRALAGILTPAQAAQFLGITLSLNENGSDNPLQIPASDAINDSESEMLLVPYVLNDSVHHQQSHPLDVVLQFQSNIFNHSRRSSGIVNNSVHRRFVNRSQASSQPLIINGCRQLTNLEIAGCSAVTDHGLSALARNCKSLEKLDLEDCGMVTDTTLGQLAAHCSRLNTLVLSHCDQITDNGIGRLVGGLCGPVRLQNLAMDNCPLLTDTSLEYLGNTCRELRKLELFDCMLITKEGISNLKTKSPRVEVHAYFAPETPPGNTVTRRRRFCRCCNIL